MQRRIGISGMVLTLLLMSLLTSAFGIHPAESRGNHVSGTGGSLGTIHWGSGVVNESDYFNFGTGDIFWSIANEESGYFYGGDSTPTLYFADRIEGYPYDTYQGVDYIWEFTNAEDHEWFTQHCIMFTEETSPSYRGILLIQQGGLYGAIRPRSIHDGNMTHPEEYVLEYDWWYDDSGGSDFSSLKPSIAIYTDKSSYSTGETMYLGLDVTNPNGQVNVCFAVWVVRPGGAISVYMHLHNLALPASLSYKNPAFRTITLPSLPPGTYVWHAAFLTPLHTIIAEDTAQWQFS